MRHPVPVDVSWLLWAFFIAQLFIPLAQRRWLETKRQLAIRALERSRGSRVITMIHRQETMSILGFPVARYIDIEDSEQVLRAVRLTPPDMPIDMLLHTPGGFVLAADEIAMDANAVLGPVDPQLGMGQTSYPAASVLKALAQPNPNRDDATLILGDVAEKALRQVHDTVVKLLADRHAPDDAERIATTLTSGRW